MERSLTQPDPVPRPARRARRRRTLASLLTQLLIVLALRSVHAPAFAADATPSAGGWIEFSANWSAAGQEHTLVLGGRSAATFELSGPFVVTRGDGLGSGFFARAIGFVDKGSVGIARMLLTDESGDAIFNDLRGQGLGHR